MPVTFRHSSFCRSQDGFIPEGCVYLSILVKYLLWKQQKASVPLIAGASLRFLAGIEGNEDMQHLDNEIKELNESNLKIEADMMQLQTQVGHRRQPWTCQAML